MEETAQAHRQAVAAVADAQKHHDDALAAHERANAAIAESDLDHQSTLYRADVARLEGALASQAAQIEIDAKKLRRLREVAERIVLLQARKDAALTRIEYRLTQPITVDGVALEDDGELWLEGERTFALRDLAN